MGATSNARDLEQSCWMGLRRVEDLRPGDEQMGKVWDYRSECEPFPVDWMLTRCEPFELSS